MHAFINALRSTAYFLVRRSVFLLLGAGIGYTYGYRQAGTGKPSLVSRVQSLVGVNHVRDDHMRRQQAIQAIRQARMDALEAQLPH